MGTTPVFGLPYPEDTDLVRDGAGAIQALATATETGLLAVAGMRYAPAAQNIPNNTTTNANLGTAASYSGGVIGADGGLRVPVAGWYVVAASWGWEANGTGFRVVELFDQVTGNSLAKSSKAASGASDAAVTIVNVVPLSALAVVKVRVFQNSGGTLASRNTAPRSLGVGLLGAFPDAVTPDLVQSTQAPAAYNEGGEEA